MFQNDKGRLLTPMSHEISGGEGEGVTPPKEGTTPKSKFTDVDKQIVYIGVIDC